MSPLGDDGCKPDSVRHGLSPCAWTAICLTSAPCDWDEVLADCDQYPAGSAACAASRAGGPLPPVLSCTTWGFSCPLAYARGGGLLPRLFTLTNPALARGGGLFSVTLSVGWGFRSNLPRILRGMLPCGVRTFLSPPSLTTLGERPSAIGGDPTRLRGLIKRRCLTPRLPAPAKAAGCGSRRCECRLFRPRGLGR